ncbi:MAG: hypothetical protein J6B12_05650 [Clostridia bacterium]|nr:hypothetical protein [Clostridia bacterium]
MSEKKYFASANSTKGFVNYFPDVFGKCRRLYVVLGGPGTGKSRFLRDVAARGHEVEYYYCSSDASSLDGVLIDGWAGLVDGTAPHIWNPSCVGAFEQIVNLGEFWNPRLLSANRAEIDALAREKSECYTQSYAFLAAIGEAEKGIRARLEEALDEGKLRRAAARLLRGITGDGKGTRKIGLCSALGMMGRAHFDTYEKETYAFAISDSMGAAWLLLGKLDQLCQEKGISRRVAQSPLFPDKVEAISLMGEDISFFVGGGEDAISMKKFFRADSLRAMRQVLRSTREAQARLEDLALEALSRAAKAHFALEEIYSSTMDFAAKEQFTAEFCQKLFG